MRKRKKFTYNEKSCVICGKPYTPTSPKQKACPGCRHILVEKHNKERKHKEKVKKQINIVRNKSLLTDAKEAKRSGMTYGQYKAMEYMKQNNL